MNTAFIKLKEFLETVRNYNIYLNNAMENEYGDDWNYKALSSFLYNLGVESFDDYDEPILKIQMKDGILTLEHTSQGLEVVFESKNSNKLQSKLLYPINGRNNEDPGKSSLRDLIFALDEFSTKEVIDEVYFLKIDDYNDKTFENKATITSFKDRVKMKINYPNNMNKFNNSKSNRNFNQKRQLMHRRRV